MIIEARYNGPVDSGNGGWTAGTVAGEFGATVPVSITLRIPPPLDTPLSVVHEQDQIRVYAHGATLVADGTPVEVAPDDLPPVTFAAAEEISKSYRGFAAHPFSTCFVCGPAREPGDGMRLFPGPAADGVTATPWIVPDEVSAPMIWAALDCPGGWAVGIEARPYVLGRMATHIRTMPEPGAQCVVMGHLLGLDGRKALVASTLFGPDGDPLASSRATWIAIA
jgi:hypothetical protein